MNKITFSLVLFIFSCINPAFSQQSGSLAEKMAANGISTAIENPHRCGTDERHELMMQDPEFANAYNLQRERAHQAIENKSLPACTNPIIFPVVIHFTPTNVPTQCMIDATIAQIDQLNLDFAGCNSNAGLFCDWIEAGCDNFGGTAGGDAKDVDGSCFQFCLADQNLPNDNNLIPGGLAITTGYSVDNQNAPAMWNGYLNVYVGNIGGGVLGFVNFLGGAGNTNTSLGSSVLMSAFGGQGFAGCNGVGTGAPFDGGATLTHEIGHWFGLDHTFSDNVTDTPPQNQPNFGCVTINTGNCTSSVGPDYGANFMDYVDDDCMFMFTEDQITIMQNTVAPQNQWATNSMSCTITYPTCAQQGLCTVVCPTTVSAPYSATEDICIISGSTYNLPTDFSTVSLDEGGSATFTWSTGAYMSAGGSAVTGSAITLPTPTTCAPIVETFYLNTGCSDGSIQEINAGTLVLTVYPDPTQFAPADLVTFTDGTCGGPAFTVSPDCASFITVTQNGGPAFPVTSGAGAVDYDVALNYPVECCCPATASSETQSSTATVTIPDGGGVANQGCTTVTINSGDPVTGATVDLDITHTWIGDLVITLTSPAGTTITLGDQPGVPGSQFGCAGNDISVTFDDAASNTAAAFENACANAPAISGAYQPVDPLSSFAGESAAGTWTICAYDNVNQDGGSITNFGLTVDTEVPCTAPVDCAFVGTANYNCSGTACASVDLDILFDGFPSQTSWEILDNNGAVVASSGGTYSGTSGNSTVTESSCLFDGCYTLNFNDATGNGLCPFRATASSLGTFITPGTIIQPGTIVATLGTIVSPGLCGNFALTDANGTTLASGGGSFGSLSSQQFCLSGGLANLWGGEDSNAYQRRSEANGLNVFPTLAKDNLSVQYSSQTTEPIQVNIVDINGQIIRQYEQRTPLTQLNISDLSAGIYFVQMLANDTVLVEKFVKQ